MPHPVVLTPTLAEELIRYATFAYRCSKCTTRPPVRHWRVLVSLLALIQLAYIGAVFWPRRQRLLQGARAFIRQALSGEPTRFMQYALLDAPSRAVRDYIDNGAGHMYALLSQQFDLRLDALVNAAMSQAERLAIDPDMPSGVSSLISDTLHRVGPEISRAIRRHAESSILSPFTIRFGASRNGGHHITPQVAPVVDDSVQRPPLINNAVRTTTDHSLVSLTGAEIVSFANPISVQSPQRHPKLFRDNSLWKYLARLLGLLVVDIAGRVLHLVRRARAHVLYKLQPFDRSMWACFKDPQVWPSRFAGLRNAQALPNVLQCCFRSTLHHALRGFLTTVLDIQCHWRYAVSNLASRAVVVRRVLCAGCDRRVPGCLIYRRIRNCK
jgi:hypothetical protein